MRYMRLLLKVAGALFFLAGVGAATLAMVHPDFDGVDVMVFGIGGMVLALVGLSIMRLAEDV